MEKVGEGWRLEKVGEGLRRLEKVREGQRKLEKVGKVLLCCVPVFLLD